MAVDTAAPRAEAERDEPPFAPSLLEELLRQLDKTVRARQLYLPNNPAYQGALQKLRGAFVPIWAQTDAITLHVTDMQFTWEGVVVHDHPAKASDTLPWLFFKDGVREITLTAGFETSEVELLLDIIPRVRRALPDEDDLITMLWEQEFAHLTYKYVDLGQESAAPLTAGAEPGKYPSGGGRAPDAAEAPPASAGAGEAAPEPPPRAGVVRLEDFDSTLYFLEQKEIDYITRDIAREYASDLRRTVLDALLDIFEVQPDAAVRTEVLQHLDQMVLHLLAAGRLDTVAYLLREAGTVIGRATALDPLHVEQLKSLPSRLSEPATLAQILQQLDESAELPAQDDLNALFGELTASSLVTVFAWLDRLRTPALRALLEEAAGRLAATSTGELVRLISQGTPDVVLQAIRRAGALKATAAVGPIAKVLADPQPALRQAAVAALVEIGSPGSMQALERALGDAERDIRITAVRALGSRGHRAALGRLEAMVKSKELRALDLTERMAVFEAFGQLCGDSGVPYLDGVLNGKSGLLGRREDPDVRACAAMALGHVRTARSAQALQTALAEKDAVVRSAVNRALRAGAA